jgi:hypothetical protein
MLNIEKLVLERSGSAVWEKSECGRESFGWAKGGLAEPHNCRTELGGVCQTVRPEGGVGASRSP